MSLKVINSGKNSTQILLDGFRYMRNKKPSGPNLRAYYACIEKRTKCPATIGTIGADDALQLKLHGREKPHNHPPDEADNEAKEILHTYREMAKENPHRPAKAAFEAVIAQKGKEGADPTTDPGLQKLGPYESHSTMWYRIRAKQIGKQPKDLTEVDILKYGSLTKTLNDGPLYRGKTKSGAEIFISDSQVQIASPCTHLFIDGTHLTCPPPWPQTVVLRGKTGDSVHTIGWALLPNKLEKTYKEVLQKFKDICSEADQPLDFSYVHQDCEVAMINAVKCVFPDAEIKLCLFHIEDAIWRKVNSLGLKPLLKKKIFVNSTKPAKIFSFIHMSSGHLNWIGVECGVTYSKSSPVKLETIQPLHN